MDVNQKRELYNGFGDTMARAVEFAGAPIVFGLFGRWLDDTFGTEPVLLIAMLVFAVVGVIVRSYYQYKARMDSITAASPWAASRAASREETA